MEQILFYCFSAVLIFAATMVITVRNPVRAALFLVLAFFYQCRYLVAIGSRVFSIDPCLGLCRRGHGVIPICGDDVGY